jgi:hypothetical protein
MLKDKIKNIETKPVKIFRKPIDEKRFNKKFLKFIELPQDKQFFLSCFNLKEGKYTIAQSLDKSAIKKLKDLNKII